MNPCCSKVYWFIHTVYVWNIFLRKNFQEKVCQKLIYVKIRIRTFSKSDPEPDVFISLIRTRSKIVRIRNTAIKPAIFFFYRLWTRRFYDSGERGRSNTLSRLSGNLAVARTQNKNSVFNNLSRSSRYSSHFDKEVHHSHL
jgi:hypothetical protein